MMSYGEEATHFGTAVALDDKDMVYAQYREPGMSHLSLSLSLYYIYLCIRCIAMAWL